MAHVASVDWPGRRIFLHQDTATQGFSPIAAHFEIAALVVANANAEQNYLQPTAAEGNLPKDNADPNLATKFTPRYARLFPAWRWIPWGGASHRIDLLDEVISDDGLADRDTFDRSLLPIGIEVDIDAVYQQVETVVVRTTNSLEPSNIAELWAHVNVATGLSIEALMEGLHKLLRADAIVDAGQLTLREEGTATVLLRKDLTTGQPLIPGTLEEAP